MKRRMDEERMSKENAVQNESEIQNESGTCDQAALLDAFLDGELPEDEADRVREHLDTCPDCRAYLDDILAIREAFPTLEDTAVPEGFAERTLDRLPPRISVLRGGGWRKQWRRTALPIAASLALILALRGMWLTGGPTGGGEVMSRTLPVAEETVQEADEAAPEAQETVQDTKAAKETEDAAEASALPAGTPEDTGSGAAETAEAAILDAGTPGNGETVDAADGKNAANGKTAGNGTDSAENGESAGNGTDSAAADSAPAGTGTAPAAETSAGTNTASKPAGNRNQEQKPANPKDNGGKPVTNSKTDNGGKPSNGTPGGTAAGGTGKQQAGTSAPSESAAVTESNAPAAPESTVPDAEQTATASEGQTPATPAASASEQAVSAEPPAPQVPDPENPRDGWVSRDWESGGSSPVSGYEETDSPVSLLGLEEPEEDKSRAGGERETAGGGETAAGGGVSNEEAPNGGASSDSASGEPEVRNTAHRVMYLPPEAAPYMEQYRLSEQAADGTWYELTGAQFKALARALEDTGLTDESKWASEAAVTEDGDTVYVVLRNG